MSTLTTPQVSATIDRLFQLEERAALDEAWSRLPAGDRDRMMHSKTDYLDFYTLLKEQPLAISRETGILLYALARNGGARHIVEFGTSLGVSTIYLAAALRENGGGDLITSEFEPGKVAQATENLAAAGLLDLVEIREGDALQTLAAGVPDAIDILFLDGAKPLYLDVLEMLEPSLRSGALVLADDAEFSPEYLAYVRSMGNGYLSVSVGDGVELSVRLG